KDRNPVGLLVTRDKTAVPNLDERPGELQAGRRLPAAGGEGDGVDVFSESGEHGARARDLVRGVSPECAIQALDEQTTHVIEGGAGGSASSAPECLLCDAAIRRVRVRGPVERGQWKAERVEERLGVERRIDIGSPGERSV